MESSHGERRHCIIQTENVQELQPQLQCTESIQVWRKAQKNETSSCGSRQRDEKLHEEKLRTEETGSG